MVLRLIAEPWWRYSGADGLRVMSGLSGLLQCLAMLVFVLAMWQRVRTKEYILKLRQSQAKEG